MSVSPLDQTYELITESVAAENIEGEVIIVHFDSGNYFSLRGAAYHAWNEMIGGSVPPAKLVSLVTAEETAAMNQVARFVDVLVAENVIRPSRGTPGEISTSAALPFNELVIEKYEDMQLLLLGDPIHEVEDAGWPMMREDLT